MFDVLFHRAARQRAVEKNEDKKQGGRGGHRKGQIVKAFVGDVGSEHQPKQAYGPDRSEVSERPLQSGGDAHFRRGSLQVNSGLRWV